MHQRLARGLQPGDRVCEILFGISERVRPGRCVELVHQGLAFVDDLLRQRSGHLGLEGQHVERDQAGG